MREVLTVVIEYSVIRECPKDPIQRPGVQAAGPRQSFRSGRRIAQVVRNAKFSDQVHTARRPVGDRKVLDDLGGRWISAQSWPLNRAVG